MKTKHLIRALTLGRTPTRIRTHGLCSSTAPSVADVALKNVTKSNFEPALAELRRHVKHADFVSIDLEMTGITSAPWRDCFEFDRLDIQYLKIKDSAEKFAVVQFGVCPFRWDSHSNAFVAYPHNFFIFPRQESVSDGVSSEFLCQTSSMEFLAKYQFDFNACVYEGISYLSRSQEEEALRQLDSRDMVFPDLSKKLGDGVDTKLVRMADILFAERMKNTLSEWRARILQEGSRGSEFLGSLNDSKQKFETTFLHMRPALVLNGMSSRQLSLIKLITVKHFKDLAYVSVAGETSSSQPMVVYTDSTTDREMLMKDVKACQRKESEMKIKAAIGFRHVIDLLSSERKLIVGHNCFLDLAHIYNKFVGPLPESAEGFVTALQTHFPHIVDTKVMLNSDNELLRILRRGSTSLSKAFNLLCRPIVPYGNKQIKVEVEVDDQRFSNWNSGAKHEAGYDAFMTGCVFCQACSHLGIDFNADTPSLDFLKNEKLQKYTNHLYLSWVNGDIVDLKTGKATAESFGSTNARHKHLKPIYSNMILLWGPPPKLRSDVIRSCFNKVFGMGCITSLYHLDETAVFIHLSRADIVSNFLDLRDSLARESGPISVLHPLSHILGSGGVCAAPYEIYKELCRSHPSEILLADQAVAVGIDLKATSMMYRGIDVEQLVDERSTDVCADFQQNNPLQSDGYIDSFCTSEAQLSK